MSVKQPASCEPSPASSFEGGNDEHGAAVAEAVAEADAQVQRSKSILSIEELEHESRTQEAELAETRLVRQVQEVCVERGVFVFSRPSVLCTALGLEDELTPHRAGRWALRRILVPAASLERAPGPTDESEAKSFTQDVNAVAWATLTTTTAAGANVVGAAVDWGSWLLRPAQAVVESGAGYITAGIGAVGGFAAAPIGLITGAVAPSKPEQPQTPAAAASCAASEASGAVGGASSSQMLQDGSFEQPDSAVSFGMDDFNAQAAAIDESCRIVFDLPSGSASDLTIVYRPALHRIAARVVNHLVERTRSGGALSRVITWDDWSEFILVDENVTHVAEITNFLTNHAQVVRPLECSLGRGLFLAAQLSETAESMLWPVEVACALLEHKLRAEQLNRIVPQWEDRLNDLTTSGDADGSAIGRKRAEELKWLIAANKLVQIEVGKTLARALKAGHLAPKAALNAIEERLANFDDISVYPMSDPQAAKEALQVEQVPDTPKPAEPAAADAPSADEPSNEPHAAVDEA